MGGCGRQCHFPRMWLSKLQVSVCTAIMIVLVILRSWLVVWQGFAPMTSYSQIKHCTNWPNAPDWYRYYYYLQRGVNGETVPPPMVTSSIVESVQQESFQVGELLFVYNNPLIHLSDIVHALWLVNLKDHILWYGALLCRLLARIWKVGIQNY